MSFGLEFCTVRVLCHNCGWFRKIGYTGIKDNIRAVIKIQKSKDPSHILQGKVLEFPVEKSLEEIAVTNPDFRDLDAEAHQKGLNSTMNEFNFLLQDALCPRCRQEGNLCLDSCVFQGREIKF